MGTANYGIEIYMPLSPSVVLSLLCEKTFDELVAKYEKNKEQLDRKGLFQTRNFVNGVRRKIPIECINENVENLNSLQVIFSERFLFSKNNDFKLAHEMIEENGELKKGHRSVIG